MHAADFAAALAGGPVTAPVLLVCAHPDDETIGLGAHLDRLPGLHLLHVTDGAPRDGADARAHGFADVAEYAAARRAELATAMALAGVSRLETLDLPDQGVVRALPAAARGIAAAIARVRPALVITHAYEGGHPDHDAVACAAAVASADAHVPLLEMTGYHRVCDAFRTGAFLPASDRPEWTLQPDAAATARKRAMLACFASQAATLAAFPIGPERLRAAPAYDFTQPPHAGPLHYEQFDWGVDGAAFRTRVAEWRRCR